MVPTLIADIMVSSPSLSGKPIITPGNIIGEISGEISSVRFSRKLYVFERTAVAMAGPENLIQDALRKLRLINDGPERPTKWLVDAVNTINAQYRESLSTLCIHALKEGNSSYSIAVRRSRTFSDEKWGDCASIGSGGDRLKDLLFSLDSGDLPPARHLHEAIAILNGLIFGQEMTIGAQSATGGYLEYALWTGKEWLRGPKTLHIFMIIAPAGEAYATAMLGRATAYDPAGRMITVSETRNGGSVHDLVLKDLIQDNHVNAGTLDFWKGWQPHIVVVTFVGRHRDGRIMCFPFVIDKSKVIFSIRESGYLLGLESEQFAHEVSEMCLRRHKLLFDPNGEVPGNWL